MKIDSYNTKKIKVLSSVLILLVLYIHSFYNEAIGTKYASFVQVFLGNGGVSNVAVPMFFAISGVLFFNGITSIQDCFPKIKKRIKSLLIPYVIWNIIFVLWFVVLQNLPFTKNMINSDVVSKVFCGSLIDSLNFVFVKPAAFHLWFLRDLIIMVFLSPLLYVFMKYTKKYGVAALLLLTPFIRSLSQTFDQFGIAFLALGGVIGLLLDVNTLSEKISKPVTIISAIIFMGVSIIHALQIETHFPLLTIVQILAGMVVFWKAYDYFVSKESIKKIFKPINGILGYSFFVYLFHEPAFNILKKLGLNVLGSSEGTLILLFLVNPIIMMAISVAVAKILKRIIPSVYSVFVGGR